MTNSNFERDYHANAGLVGGDKISPEMFDNATASDGYPGLQKAIRNIIHGFQGACIISWDATGNLAPTGTYDDVDVDDGYIFTKDDDGESVVVYCAAVEGLDIDAITKCVVASNDGIVSVKTIASVLTTDAVVALRGETADELIDVRNLNDGANKIDRKYRDIKIAGNLEVEKSVYTCGSLADINTALSSIGSGSGRIIIKNGSISVTSAIEVNGGGSYIIQGQGDETELDMTDGNEVFNVTNCTSCVIRDLKIDYQAETGTTPGILVTKDTALNVVIRNVTIDGNSGTNGVAIQVDNSGGSATSDVTIDGCRISGVTTGIQVDYGIDPLVINNRITNLEGTAGGCYGINFDNGTRGIIANNYIEDLTGDFEVFGVRNQNTSVIISGNTIRTLVAANLLGSGVNAWAAGVANIVSGSADVVGNVITGIDVDADTSTSAQVAAGIVLSSYCNASGNVVRDIDLSAEGSAIGIYMVNHFNVVSGNVIQDIQGYDVSIGIGGSSQADGNTVSGNSIVKIGDDYTATTDGYGISMAGDDNAVVGNTCTNIDTAALKDIGAGGDYCTWVGNAANGEGKSLTGTGVVDEHNIT